MIGKTAMDEILEALRQANTRVELDTFGVGYAYTGYSGPIQSIAPVLVPIQNDQAVELFYNYAVTPWFRLTPDLQILVPARERTLRLLRAGRGTSRKPNPRSDSTFY